MEAIKAFLVYFKNGRKVVRFLLLKVLFSSSVEDNQPEKGPRAGKPVRKSKCLGHGIIVK